MNTKKCNPCSGSGKVRVGSPYEQDATCECPLCEGGGILVQGEGGWESKNAWARGVWVGIRFLILQLEQNGFTLEVDDVESRDGMPVFVYGDHITLMKHMEGKELPEAVPMS